MQPKIKGKSLDEWIEDFGQMVQLKAENEALKNQLLIMQSGIEKAAESELEEFRLNNILQARLRRIKKVVRKVLGITFKVASNIEKKGHRNRAKKLISRIKDYTKSI